MSARPEPSSWRAQQAEGSPDCDRPPTPTLAQPRLILRVAKRVDAVVTPTGRDIAARLRTVPMSESPVDRFLEHQAA